MWWREEPVTLYQDVIFSSHWPQMHYFTFPWMVMLYFINTNQYVGVGLLLFVCLFVGYFLLGLLGFFGNEWQATCSRKYMYVINFWNSRSHAHMVYPTLKLGWKEISRFVGKVRKTWDMTQPEGATVKPDKWHRNSVALSVHLYAMTKRYWQWERTNYFICPWMLCLKSASPDTKKWSVLSIPGTIPMRQLYIFLQADVSILMLSSFLSALSSLCTYSRVYYLFSQKLWEIIYNTCWH